MKRMPLVKNFMTPFPYSAGVGASLAEAQAFMREKKIRHLPVSDQGRLVGLITDRDIKLLLGPDFASPDARGLKAGDAMLPDPYTVELNTSLAEVMSQMAARHIGSAIVTRKGKLAGVFTHSDACRAFADYLNEHFATGGGNHAA